MKLEVTQNNFAKALNNIARVTTSRAGLPILQNILLRTEKSRLLIAATNLEVASTQRIGAKVTTQGSITVPAKVISEFIANLPNDTVVIEVKGSVIHISSGSHSSTINGLVDDEFPELPAIDETANINYELIVADFKEAATQTIITASNDATRPVLTGLYWHTYENNLYFAATDGYRLAEKKVMPVKTDIAAIIPVSTIQEVMRIISDESVLQVEFDETQVKFTIGDNEITSRLIDGNYPDYRQLIPSSNATSFVVDGSDLKRVVKLSGLFARESGGSVQLEADADNSTLTIHSVASEVGQNISTITTKITGKSGVITLNSRYLTDALSVIEGDELTIGFSEKLSPCVITPVSKTGDYTHIIMPLKS